MSNGNSPFTTATIAPPRTHRRPAPEAAPCCRPEPCACPACGGLECLCRPRFFAGQLLTEEDLNRLDHYIVAKHRLHNRHLHGWGVVCGLEVLCHRCENLVTVSSGYALGPCGEDIVVCDKEVVDVCALIQRCRSAERRRWECEPCPPYRQDDECKEATEEWILAIRYDERATRGITPLRRDDPCCPKCECGCSGSCRCDCHVQEKTACKPKPPQCEPTVTCEGYRFEVCRVPKENDTKDRGRLVARFEECLDALKEAVDLKVLLDAAADPPPAAGQLHQLCCETKEALYRLFSTRPTGTCDWCERLARIDCTPLQSAAGAPPSLPTQAVQQLARLAVEYIVHCLCSALLPPCPEPVCDPRVPLASITIRKRDCQILRVCNWTQWRKLATTFPSLGYWLAVLGLGRTLRERLEALCCAALGVQAQTVPPLTHHPEGDAAPAEPPSATTAEPTLRAALSKSSAERARTLSELSAGALAHRGQSLTASQLLNGVLGGRTAAGEAVLTDSERQNLTQFMLLNFAAGPILEAFVPASAGPAPSPAGSSEEPANLHTEMNGLRDELAGLRRTVSNQAGRITRLKKQIEERG